MPETQKHKIIKTGKFYLLHDGSKIGHPGYVVWKDDEGNLYLAVKFGSTKNDKNLKFDFPISKDVSVSYIYKRPFLGKRKDYGKELTKLFPLDSNNNMIFNISSNEPVFSKTLSRNDKRRYKKHKKTVK